MHCRTPVAAAMETNAIETAAESANRDAGADHFRFFLPRPYVVELVLIVYVHPRLGQFAAEVFRRMAL